MNAGEGMYYKRAKPEKHQYIYMNALYFNSFFLTKLYAI
jgi:hypothetical protein